MKMPLLTLRRSSSLPILALILCLSPLIQAVPASVLAQDTELSTSAYHKLQLQQQQQQQLEKQQQQKQQQQQQQPAAAKRSEEASALPSADKKSSPEIVPASFSNAPSARNAPIPAISSSQQVPSGIYALPSNDEILAAVAAAAQNSQQQLQEEPTPLEEAVASSTMRKRGVNYEYNPYLSAAASDYGSDVPNGVWSDDYEAAVPVSYGERDLQEIDDYVPERRVSGSSARNKAYDNLQNLLNAEAYLESIPLSVPLTYANRNYNLDDRNKRGIYYNMGGSGANSASSLGIDTGYNSENINLNKYRRFNDMRLKRDTQLNPADMLALVALVEAGERARKESDVESSVAVPMVASDDLDYVPAASWMDVPVQAQPALVDYYGMPLDNQNQLMPKYEYVPRQHKYTGVNSRFGASKQRYMVAKKKRSISQSQFMNEPVAERGSSYNGEKYF
ncbi:probable serine/threonine-protein kinase tsuA [Drosophila gunungcola]|uniref:probable serine/threonine-protein kinase tsuA n=1 Tax=Drosophila gunungcola TaxID=103775 RepID=UPI0022DEAD19|nr:probable serine/threonine-protein kinase tsuA [Drosophila gunungcola]